jgi:hypothetical protein
VLIVEIWKDIQEYEGLYQVSNLGNVKSIHNSKTIILKPRKIKDGYLMVSLYKHNKPKNCQIHRLVAKHFLNNYDEKLEVNHIDYNKENNTVDNLEMITRYDNVYDYFHKNSKTGIVGIDKCKGKYYRVRYKSKYIGQFKTMQEAENALISARKEV